MNEHLDTVRQHFHDIAARYADLFAEHAGSHQFPGGPIRVETSLAALARHLDGGLVADLGCGTGHTALSLCERGFEVVGVDFAPGMVETSRALLDASPHAERATFHVADACDVPVPDGQADAVLALGVTEWLEDDVALAAEAARLLRPGGIAIVSFRNRLFNLFSANAHTAAELDSGEVARLLGELREELARETDPAALDAAAAALGSAAARLAAPPPPDVEGPLPGKPVKLRAHTPAEAAAAYGAPGLDHVETLYTHFHPFPPGFEGTNPRAFNHLAVALESLARTPIGALMASGFLTVLRKR